MADAKKKLGREELEATPEYQQLTAKQQLFVMTYCMAGLVDGHYDQTAATQTAYNCKNLESARVMSYSLIANIRIVAALNRHFNREPIEEFLRQVDRAIVNKKLSIAQINALKLKADVLGFAARLPGTNNQATGVLPTDVLEASEAARKAKRKPRTPKPPPEKPNTDYGFGNN
jgi:hypothetical protein